MPRLQNNATLYAKKHEESKPLLHAQGPLLAKKPAGTSAYLQALPLARQSRSSMLNIDLTVVQKSCIQIWVLADHNSHMHMIFHLRYVASHQEITQNTSKTQGSRKVGASVSMHVWTIWI